MGLNREQIIKALECCTSGNSVSACMSGCPLYEKEDCECINDDTALLKYALSLIKELTEENERLRELGTTKEIEKEIVRRETRADTVRKMQEQIKAEIDCFDKRGGSAFINKSIVFWFIDQIAKEMLEGEK